MDAAHGKFKKVRELMSSAKPATHKSPSFQEIMDGLKDIEKDAFLNAVQIDFMTFRFSDQIDKLPLREAHEIIDLVMARFANTPTPSGRKWMPMDIFMAILNPDIPPEMIEEIGDVT